MSFNSPTMPFDWMFSSLSFIKSVLQDEFSQLLSKEYICSSNPCWSKNKSYHTLYNSSILQSKNITTHLLTKNEMADYYNFHMWSHYNLLEEEQYVKYEKYVKRFQSMTKSNHLKIFLYIQYYDDTISDVIDLNNYLSNIIKNYKFVCIHCKKVNKEIINNTLVCTYNINNLYIYDLEIENYQDNLEQSALQQIKKELDIIIKTNHS
jgi:hypothetical protein